MNTPSENVNSSQLRSPAGILKRQSPLPLAEPWLKVSKYATDVQPLSARLPPAVESVLVSLVLVRTAKGVEGLVTLEAPQTCSPVGVDFVFAVDKSGSMMGSKLATVIKVLEWAAGGGLQPEDRACIVSFDHAADLVLPLTSLHDEAGQAAFRDAARLLRAAGGTCISGALGVSAGVLRDRRFKNDSASVLLLSDGIDETALKRSEAAVAALKSVTTVRAIGIGEDHDPILLSKLAKAVHGDFAYAANSEAIAATMGAAVGAAKSCVATSLDSLVISTGEGVVLRSITDAGTLCAGERRVYHFAHAGAVASVAAKLSYVKPGMVVAHKESAAPLLEDAPTETLVLIESHACREAVAAGILQATRCARHGKFGEAAALLDTIIARVSGSIAADTEMCVALLRDLEGAKSDCSSFSQFNDGGLARMTSNGARHMNMRSTGDRDDFYATPSMMAAATQAVQASLPI